MRVVIAGGRDFDNLPLMRKGWDESPFPITECVSGKQRTWNEKRRRFHGADYQGEIVARERSIPIAPFPAEWTRLGKPAGPIRNRQMAEYADALIAFWDGKSSGTKNMIDSMNGLGKPVIIVPYRATSTAHE